MAFRRWGGLTEYAWHADFQGAGNAAAAALLLDAWGDSRTPRDSQRRGINWCWRQGWRTHRRFSWRTLERSGIFREHGCGPGAGRRPVPRYRPETGSS